MKLTVSQELKFQQSSLTEIALDLNVRKVLLCLLFVVL